MINTLNDSWKSPFSIKIIENFIDDKYFMFFNDLIKNKTFIPAVQGVNGKNVVQPLHKIRLDYTLNTKECSFIDKPFILKADCNCNLRERWRLLYYKGEDKSFRGPHTDWTNFSCHRRMSIVIGLSNISDYTGGELVFKNNGLSFKLNKGTAVIFDSKLVHEVLPVTKGDRYVIQSFLFDNSGYNLKSNKNGLENFKLLDYPINHTLLKNIYFNNFILKDNKNAVHSKLASVEDCYLGYFSYLDEVKEYLNNNKEIYCFTWHKPEHLNKKWAGKAYGWTLQESIRKNRNLFQSWINEKNTISGFNPKLFNNTKNIKYLSLISTDGGPGNQIVGIKEALIMSNIINRELIMPPILQHYVINRQQRGNIINNIKYWNFDEIFCYKNINFKNLMDETTLYQNIKFLYNLKKANINKTLKMENIIKFNVNIKNKMLNKKNFSEIKDYQELLNLEDEFLIIKDLYNNTAISKCYWNGCDKCILNSKFSNLYKNICSQFDFSQKIKEYGDKYIKNNFNNKKFICLHLRYPDYITINDNIKTLNKIYNENDLYDIINKLLNKNNISYVFIATNNQKKILNSKLNSFYMLSNNIIYNEMESFIEQYIATQSEIFIYTGGFLAKPTHTHLRSTWSSFVLDYRNFLMNMNENPLKNIYLDDIFNEENICNIWK
ncbi:hypothetical protein crov346 [Cafeteria roenbergensis virus]|uniref:GDP-fucose protein O-fucosyltransferase 2 n=1 Tax=Cafeteria roenbergensis virus (strain BV-PW1) TaxID=693272 RepID=E3T5B7_CROVB|nr:2OG-Fe(II) oxygenase [Cafeteria roenbergensis virus BV-PW1]ADO67380.1 hypothetical protein crov346 [Cafeteria roenbergensis virus BV-PW1]